MEASEKGSVQSIITDIQNNLPKLNLPQLEAIAEQVNQIYEQAKQRHAPESTIQGSVSSMMTGKSQEEQKA